MLTLFWCAIGAVVLVAALYADRLQQAADWEAEMHVNRGVVAELERKRALALVSELEEKPPLHWKQADERRFRIVKKGAA